MALSRGSSGSDVAKFASRGTGSNANEAILRGGSVSDALDDTGQFLANPLGQAVGVSPEEVLHTSVNVPDSVKSTLTMGLSDSLPEDQERAIHALATAGASDVINTGLQGGSISDSVEGTLKTLGDPAHEILGLPSAMSSLEAFFGISAEEAAKEGARMQAETARLALDEQKRALGTAREDLQPFVQAGLEQLPGLKQTMGQLASTQAPELQNFNTFGLAGQIGDRSMAGMHKLTGAAHDAQQQGIDRQNLLQGEVFQGGLDPNILNNQFNQGLQGLAQQQLSGSAADGFQGAVGKEAALLGTTLQSQGLQDRLAQNNQRFNQIQQRFNTGRQAQQQAFGQQAAGIGFGVGGLQQQAGQMGAAQQLFNAPLQQDFQNQLAAQQQAFGQQGNLVSGGQAAAAGQAQAGQAAGRSVSELLTGLGNSQAASLIAGANAQGQGAQNALNTGFSIFDLFV